MNGIDKIIDRISGDAKAEAEAILAQVRAQAAETAARYGEQAENLRREILTRGEKEAVLRGQRLDAVAQLEGRKTLLGAKQEVIEDAFALALKKLRELPEDHMVALLASLAANAAVSGGECLIFAPNDREKLGEKVVAAANEKLGEKGKLTLSGQTRDLPGGFVLSGGSVEVNCGFDTLVRLHKAELTGEVAAILFS